MNRIDITKDVQVSQLNSFIDTLPYLNRFKDSKLNKNRNFEIVNDHKFLIFFSNHNISFSFFSQTMLDIEKILPLWQLSFFFGGV